MSNFNPAAFAEQVLTDSNDTVIIPVPEGEYPGVVESFKIDTWASRDGSKSGVKLKLVWALDAPGLKEAIGGRDPKVNHDVMLDTDERGMLDMGKGKNIGLGRLRAALDMNAPGQPFSFQNIPGKMAKVLVKHRTGETAESIFAEVKAVAPYA